MITKATPKDAKKIADINSRSKDCMDKKLGIGKGWVENHFRKMLKEKAIEAYLYEDKGVAALISHFPGYKNCELYWLTVDARYQRQGIATKLMRHVEKTARSLGKKGIYLYTHPVHKGAIKFYKQIGFSKINEFPNYYSNGDKSILMGKKLR